MFPAARLLLLVALPGLALASPFAPEPDGAVDPLGGYSLDDVWSGQWRRMYDRHGRLDPDGPPQQRLNRRIYPEYEFDLVAAGAPRADEDRWRRVPTAGRLRLQSLNEFEFAHAVQLKARAPVMDHGYVGFAFDRRAGRGYDSDLLRVDFGNESIAGSPAFARVSAYPRGEKEDIDLELVAGARWAAWGEARVRVAAFDAFIDAAYALAEGRDVVLDRHLDQQDAPLAVALELLSARVAGLRVELYGGRVLPQAIRVWHPSRPEDDHHRTHEGWLGAAMLEYRLDPVVLGVTAQRWTSRFATERFADPARDRVVREDTFRWEVYALATLPVDLTIEALLRATAADGLADPVREDAPMVGETRWLTRLVARWTPLGGYGLELGYMYGDRTLRGEVAGRLDGDDHRLLTRFVIPMGDRVWATFGVGWDLDGDTGRYDGGGLTLLITP